MAEYGDRSCRCLLANVNAAIIIIIVVLLCCCLHRNTIQLVGHGFHQKCQADPSTILRPVLSQPSPLPVIRRTVGKSKSWSIMCHPHANANADADTIPIPTKSFHERW
jgi:hypothetical protein